MVFLVSDRASTGILSVYLSYLSIMAVSADRRLGVSTVNGRLKKIDSYRSSARLILQSSCQLKLEQSDGQQVF